MLTITPFVRVVTIRSANADATRKTDVRLTAMTLFQASSACRSTPEAEMRRSGALWRIPALLTTTSAARCDS